MRSRQLQLVQAAAAVHLSATAGPSSGSAAAAPTVIIVMGVSGCGKSTVASLLSERLSCLFYEGDTYHPAANIEKMRSGTPLTDADREPWLARLAEIVEQHCKLGEPAVLSCSALKPQYRQLLRGVLPLVTASGASCGSSGSGSGAGSSGSGSGASSSAMASDASSSGSDDIRLSLATASLPLSSGVDTLIAGAATGGSSGKAAKRDGRAEGESIPQGGSSSGGGSSSAVDSCGPTDQLGAAARARMEQGSGVGFVLLEPSREQLQAWVAQRAAAGGHFMPPALLESQLATLEYSQDELLMHFGGDSFPGPQQIVECMVLRLAGAA